MLVSSARTLSAIPIISTEAKNLSDFIFTSMDHTARQVGTLFTFGMHATCICIQLSLQPNDNLKITVYNQ